VTQEEVFRLKPGDLLRVDNGTAAPRYAVVVAGAGPDVTLAWQQRQSYVVWPVGHWLTLDHAVVSSVLHRSRLTRIA
jgi:hypothetical protein